MLETDLLIGLVVVLILLVGYYLWTQHKKSSFTDYEAEFQKNQKTMNWQRTPYEPEVREEAAKGNLFDNSKYTGSASKYFPNASDYPTLSGNQIEIAEKEQYETNVIDNGSDYVHQEYIEDSVITPKMRQNQHEFSSSLQPFSGTARGVDQELEVAETLSWQGLRRPQPIKGHGLMHWVTEVDSEQLAKSSKPFNFQG